MAAKSGRFFEGLSKRILLDHAACLMCQVRAALLLPLKLPKFLPFQCYSSAVKRNWNPRLWAGFALVLVGILSYPTFFIRFPATRDFPWANLLLLALAAYLLAAGMRRAFRRPEEYRGKVAGTILASLSVLLVAFFFEQIFYVSRQIPASLGAPRMGQIAPDFTLLDTNGNPVTLSSLLNSPFSTNDWPPNGEPRDKTAATLLIFYRGYW